MTDQRFEDEQEQALIQMLPLRSAALVVSSTRWPRFSNRSLRFIFLCFIASITLTSFISSLIVGSTVVQFKQQCPLYATFQFDQQRTVRTNRTLTIHFLAEKFTPKSVCDFSTFYNVFTFIYCIMSGFFFILFNGDHRIVTRNDQCLITPWFPISTILGILSLVNATMLTNGFLKFCSAILSNHSSMISCADLNYISVVQYPDVSRLFSLILTVIIAAWLQLICFIGVIAILTIRLASSVDSKQTHAKIPSIIK